MNSRNNKSTHKDISELFLEGPAISNNNNDFWVSESQVDSEAWWELPEDIRKEYEEEWKKRKKLSNLAGELVSTSEADQFFE